MTLMPIGALKLYVCIASLVTAVHEVLQPAAGNIEYGAYLLLGCVASVGLMDAIVNDILPERFTARFAAAWKHPIFFMLAGGQLSVIYADAIYDQLSWHHIRYAVDAAGAVMAAALDLRTRFTAARDKHAVHSVRDSVA
jgi:hypothetical protein